MWLVTVSIGRYWLIYRDTARVPRGLTPRVNRVSYMTHSTILVNTVAAWGQNGEAAGLAPAVLHFA